VDSSPAPTPAKAPSGLVCAIAVAALIAGTMDYTAAITNYMLGGGKTPILIAYYIASSLLGHDTSYNGGWVTATFGVFLHYVIATGWTVLFFLLYPRLALLRKNPVLVAIGYGFFVWLMMNRVLVPLTLIQTKPFAFTRAVLQPAAIQAGILMLCIGAPLTLLARRYYGKINSPA